MVIGVIGLVIARLDDRVGQAAGRGRTSRSMTAARPDPT